LKTRGKLIRRISSFEEKKIRKFSAQKFNFFDKNKKATLKGITTQAAARQKTKDK